MPDSKMLNFIALILVLVCGINSGLEGLLGANLILGILGKFLGRLILLVFGVAAGYLIYDKFINKVKTTP